ncbi:hypothetical protein ZYGR_0AM00630 [Zygosaccharomyces rouxii]|uniref:Sugar phosphate phosphatase n=1 Tax=Zygosaccharomyces rouxii TaxID=4956 RepID=A0A1Q3AFX5_ZYGRO|nr:hypothetical protein ZYGR_0AM00630 [Zygosaccharomyces rouxii]
MIPERFKTNDPNTFGQYTATSRWPILVQNSINDLGEELKSHSGESKRQGEIIEGQLKELLEELKSDAQMRPFTQQEIATAGVPTSFNEHLADTRNEGSSWFNAGWLFAETYMYRRINVLFKSQPLWAKFDIFDRVKQSTFHSSFHGVVELALRYKTLSSQLKENSGDNEALQILFKEFIDISLWGNATDLSLLTNATLEDIKSIQGAQARKNAESKILVDDSSKAWQVLSKSKPNSRVDFVLDNSGFELYADLVLAAFLINAKLAKQCVFHGKDIPYMVSDALYKDLLKLVDNMKDTEFFPAEDEASREALNGFAQDIEKFLASGQLQFRANPFWTTNLDYWNIDPSETKYGGAEVHKDLLGSNLVIFKGDLNYRKLSGDRKWPRTTSWSEAIGPLAQNGITLLSLRTSKADVQVGLPQGLDEKLSQEWEKDHPGKGSWWTSSGKWAVISFNSSSH